MKTLDWVKNKIMSALDGVKNQIKKVKNQIKIPQNQDNLVQIKVGQLAFYGLIFASFFIALTSNVYDNDLFLREIILIIISAGIFKLIFEIKYRNYIIRELLILFFISACIFAIFFKQNGTRFFLSFIIGYSAVGLIFRYLELTFYYYDSPKVKKKLGL